MPRPVYSCSNASLNQVQRPASLSWIFFISCARTHLKKGSEVFFIALLCEREYFSTCIISCPGRCRWAISSHAWYTSVLLIRIFLVVVYSMIEFFVWIIIIINIHIFSIQRPVYHTWCFSNVCPVQDTVTGFLLAGVGHRTVNTTNFLVVKQGETFWPYRDLIPLQNVYRSRCIIVCVHICVMVFR